MCHIYLVAFSTNLIYLYFQCIREGSQLYNFNFTDADSGINAEAFFNISEVDDIIADTFEISPDGILKLKRKLDALQKDSYRVIRLSTY
jgi:hypothetical protein